jgi:hypothetical protein
LTLVIICASSSIYARFGFYLPPDAYHILQGKLIVYVDDGGVIPETIVTAKKIPVPPNLINITWDDSIGAYVKDLSVGYYIVVVRIGLI